MELKEEVCCELLQDVCHNGQLYPCKDSIPDEMTEFCEQTYSLERLRRVRGPSLNMHSLFEALHLSSFSAISPRGREFHGFQDVPLTYAFYVSRLTFYLGHSTGFASIRDPGLHGRRRSGVWVL